jgi:hypothetical protein
VVLLNTEFNLFSKVCNNNHQHTLGTDKLTRQFLYLQLDSIFFGRNPNWISPYLQYIWPVQQLFSYSVLLLPSNLATGQCCKWYLEHTISSDISIRSRYFLVLPSRSISNRHSSLKVCTYCQQHDTEFMHSLVKHEISFSPPPLLPYLPTRVYNLSISFFIYNLMMAKTYGRNM